MHNEFKVVIKQDGERRMASCPDIPGANGRGRTLTEAQESMKEAILDDRREDALLGVLRIL